MSQKNYTPACSSSGEKGIVFHLSLSRSCFSTHSESSRGFWYQIYSSIDPTNIIIVALVYFAFHVNSVSGFKLDPLIEMFDVNLKFSFLFCHSRWVKNALFCSVGERLEGERYIYKTKSIYISFRSFQESRYTQLSNFWHKN